MRKKRINERDLNALLRATLSAKRIRKPLPLLPSEFRIGQPLSNNIAHCQTESIKVIHRIVGGRPVIVAEHLFVYVTVEVEWFNCYVGSTDPTLQELPEVFDSVCVHATTDVLLCVIDHVMHVLVAQDLAPGKASPSPSPAGPCSDLRR